MDSARRRDEDLRRSLGDGLSLLLPLSLFHMFAREDSGLLTLQGCWMLFGASWILCSGVDGGRYR